MRDAIRFAATFVLVAAVLAAQGAPAPAPPDTAVAFAKTLLQHAGSKDPRVRFAVREALVTLGRVVLPVVKEAQGAETNPHVKAFLGRVAARIRKFGKLRGRSFVVGAGGFDIDRLAMELGLTFEQMAKVEPILKKYQKDVKDLYAEMKELGGFRDPEAWKDLREELKLLQEETEPKLAKVLNESQMEKMRRRLKRGGVGPMVFGGGRVQILRSGDGAIVIQTYSRGKKKENP